MQSDNIFTFEIKIAELLKMASTSAKTDILLTSNKTTSDSFKNKRSANTIEKFQVNTRSTVNMKTHLQ